MKSLNEGRGNVLSASQSLDDDRSIFVTEPVFSHRKLFLVQHHLPPHPSPPVYAGKERRSE